jgi:PAS domain S-box-containing protein
MKRVLIVDDSKLILAQLTDILVELGFAVAGKAGSGDEAVRKARKLRPDIILMDIIMPGRIDGIEAANHIRDELDIPVIFLTGHQDDTLIAGAKETGASGYLLKPVNPSELKATIEIALHRTESEKELNRFYREVIENTNDIVYVVDGKGNMKFANGQILRIGGFQKKEDIIGKSFASFLTPQSLAYAAELFKRQAKGEDIGPFEFDLVDSAGSIHTFEIRERVVWKDGRIVETHGIGREVTERRKAQEALRESELRYRLLAENANDIIFTADMDLKFTYISPSVTRLRGYTVEEAMAQPLDAIMTPSSLETLMNVFREELEIESRGTEDPSRMRRLEMEEYCKDGSTIWTETTFAGLRDANGTLIETLGITRDITERKRAERALKESEERYRSLFANSIEAAFTTDLKGHFTDVNGGFEAISGYSRDELIGLDYRRVMDSDNAERIFKAYNRLYLTREPIKDLTYNFIKKDGEVRTVEAYVNNLYDGDTIVGFQGTFRDVTEKRRIQEALIQSEAKYRELIENAIDLIFLVDLEGNFLEVNESLLRETGFSEDEILTSNFQEFLHPDDIGIALTAYEKGRAGQPFEFEMRGKKKDGSYGWYSFIIRPIGDAAGKPIYVHGIARDITEKKRADEALKVSEEKYRRVIENAQESITIIVDGVFHYANPMTERLTGYTLDELRTKSFADLVHPENREEIVKEIGRKLSGDQVTYPTDFRYVTKDGETGWYEGVAVSIPWEGKPAILSFARDITQRKLAEEALRESEEKFKNVFETSRDLMYICTLDGKILEVNEAAKRFFGYSQNEFEEINISDFYACPEERDALVRKVLENGYLEDHEMLVKNREGVAFDALVTVVTKRDKNGKAVGLQGSLRDITEKKKLEQQLIQGQKMEAIVSLAGGIAHNFNNILTGIMGYSEYLISRKTEEDPDYKALVTIHQGTIRAAELTRQLLNTARTGQYSPVKVDINEVVEKVLPLVVGTFNKSIEIRTYLDANLTAIEGDYGQLEQSLLNLCINARDAMPSGGKLIIETTNRKLDKDFVKTHLDTEEGNYVVLSVTDTGVGMAPEIKDRIYEPFFTTKGQSGGTGLGLATVYGIVKRHTGTITVYSEMGKGTTFKLYFPATTKKLKKASEKVEIADSKGKGTILIIDDDPVVREMWGDFLSRRGYRVITAEDGQRGIDIFRDQGADIDLIILDLIMPKVGGKEALTALRKMDPSIKIIVSSGYSESGQAKEILSEGVEGFIQKPALLTDLAEHVGQAFKEKA